MTKARDIADLLDASSDVKSAALDNVPPSNDASALTTGTLPIARLADGSVTAAKLENSAKTVKSATAPSSPSDGDTWYDTSIRLMKFYDATDAVWKKISSELSVLTSVSGEIIAGVSTTLTLTGTGFLSSSCTVNFTQSSDSIDEDVVVTASNNTTISVNVPAAVYNNVTSGNAVSITVTNADANTSGATNKSAVAAPSGGTITNSGGYRYHKFTGSGTFAMTLSGKTVEYLAVAGGGGAGTSNGAAGGGAGGLLQSSFTSAATNYSITVGGGGSGSSNSAARGSNGSNTTISGSNISTITCIGGGGSGSENGDAINNGNSGGSGGGGVRTNGSHGFGGAGTSGQGNAGGRNINDGSPHYRGGGGGGAGGAGQDGSASGGGNAGAGLNYSTWATATSSGDSGYYASGGACGSYDGAGAAGQASSTALGGGGQGGTNTSISQRNGQANTGGGGGGDGQVNELGGAGGSGIVLLRYQL